jgi:hypothetical protein
MKTFAALLLCTGCAHFASTPSRHLRVPQAWLAAQQQQWDELRDVLPDSLFKTTPLMADSTRLSIAERCGTTDVWEMPDIIVVHFRLATTSAERVEALAGIHGKAVSYRPVSTKPRDGIYLIWLRPTGRCDAGPISAALGTSPAVSTVMPEYLLLNMVERQPD